MPLSAKTQQSWFYVSDGKLTKYKVVFAQSRGDNSLYLRTECGHTFYTSSVFSPSKTIEGAWRRYIEELKDGLAFQLKELRKTRKEIKCIKLELDRIGAST